MNDRTRTEQGTTRSGFLATAALSAGALLNPGAASAAPRRTRTRAAASGPHQPGIATPIQRHGLFVSFRLVDDVTVDGLRGLLSDWTATANALMSGERVPERSTLAPGAPRDAGDALGLATARLTVTIGLGPGVFSRLPALASRRPAGLRDLPSFPGDRLDPAATGGDLLLQICADDQQLVSHAFRQLRPLVLGIARLAWTQAGFVSRPADGGVPRNLFGQHDGTTNPEPDSARLSRATLVRAGDGPAWTADGTYLVFRKIRMDFPTWDQTPLMNQQRVLGRRRSDGAPLSGGGPSAPLDLDARSRTGRPLIARDAHVRVAHGPEDMLRRSYNYDYGTLTAHEEHDDGAHDHGASGDHTMGHSIFDAGLLFCAYVRDPHRQFVPVMNRLAANDAMRRFLSHTGSALFFLPRRPPPARATGHDLF
jgi:deferrochelatase/peroxidase EfeB